MFLFMPAASARLPSCLAVLRAARLPPARRWQSNKASRAAQTARIFGNVKRDAPYPSTLHIKPFKPPEIDHESNVNDAELARSRQLQIDNAPPEELPARWVEILQYRERVYGGEGVSDVFAGMVLRGYQIPTEDTATAKLLWNSLLRRPVLALRVADYAAHIKEQTDKLYPHFYKDFMAYWLPKNPRVALDGHHRMLSRFQIHRVPLKALARKFRKTFSVNSDALVTFMEMYRTSNETNLYNVMVPMLCELGNLSAAREWHMVCIQRKDNPSEAVAAMHHVQLFLAEFAPEPYQPEDRSAPETKPDPVAEESDVPQDLIAEGITSRPEPRPKYNEELMRKLQGRDTPPVRFDDAFCARLFATRAFPTSGVIKGLVMAGVNEIGPQAVRQMGISADSIEELPALFTQLKESGIALQPSVFSLALEKFAMEKRFSLVRSMLESDQHPDVFGDAEVQKQLLDHYLEANDWAQAQRTLAVLALFHQDSSAAAWNLMLRAQIRHSPTHGFLPVLEYMAKQGILVEEESMSILRTVLRPRNRGRGPSASRHDDLRLLTRCYILILQSGIGMVYPASWRELIRRFGMLGRLRELRRLLFWLLHWYAPHNNPEFSSLTKPDSLEAATLRLREVYPEPFQYFNKKRSQTQRHPRHPVRTIFAPTLMQGLVNWGFRAHLLPNATYEQHMLGRIPAKRHYRKRFLAKGILKRLPWSIGLRTVVELRDLGVRVHPHTIEKALQNQFVVMFGRGRSRKKANWIMRRENRLSFPEYAREVNKIWGSTLFAVKRGDVTWSPRENMRGVSRRRWRGRDAELETAEARPTPQVADQPRHSELVKEDGGNPS